MTGKGYYLEFRIQLPGIHFKHSFAFCFDRKVSFEEEQISLVFNYLLLSFVIGPNLKTKSIFVHFVCILA